MPFFATMQSICRSRQLDRCTVILPGPIAQFTENKHREVNDVKKSNTNHMN